jgi:hypothetical protein
MKIINGQFYKTLQPKTGKIYVVGGELYNVLVYPAIMSKSGGSMATVTVTAEGAGAKTAQGGVSATVTITPQGIGQKTAQGGSEASLTVSAQGTGTKSTQGSSYATVTIQPQGNGTKTTQGGSTSNITIAAQAAGAKVAQGGSETTGVVVSAEGAGIKAITAGSTATVVIAGQGAGAKIGIGDSETGITVAVESVGMAIFNGASEVVATAIATQGAGAKTGVGDSEAVVAISAQGTGQKQTQGASETITVISAEGKFAILTTKFIPLGTFWSGDWDVPEDGVSASTTGRDRLEILRQSTYSTSEVLLNKTFYELAEIILADAKVSNYFIDDELKLLSVPYAWFEPQSHREALRKIAEASLGQVYCDREDTIRIEGASFLQTQTEPVVTITQDDYFRKSNPAKWSEIRNYIEVETQPLRPDVTQEVYRSNEPENITAGQSKTITAYYNHTPCIEATASIVGTGSITNATYYAWGATVTVTSDTAGTFELVINARPLKVLNKEKAIAKDNKSIIDNSEIRFEFPKNTLIQTREIAQRIADILLVYYANPRRDTSLDWRGNPALLLGDRVAIQDRQETADYYIVRQEIDYAGTLRAKLEGRRA